MKAVVLHRHGDNDAFVLEDNFPRPEPGTEDLLIRVRATSLNYHDIFTRRGMPGIDLEFPLIVGCDVAGEVVEVGEEVDGWRPGDRVLFDPINRTQFGMIGETTPGGLAEFMVAPAHQALAIPKGVSFDEAACLPMAYATAYRMMVARGKISRGEKVVILGASGGVGTACVQIAMLMGAEVVACASSADKLDRLAELGAHHLVDYTRRPFREQVIELFGKPNVFGTGGGADVIVNFTGGDTWVESLKCLAKGGRVLTCGATAGYAPKTDLRYIWSFEQTIVGSNGWLREDIAALMVHLERKEIFPAISTRKPLEEAVEAMELLESRSTFGKIVITQ
ncbi:zinc-binding dehydrogenase [Erythrobacter sp. AP23]|uniref:zinc-binding dehydrogenase n=1 Tax=Erythrobacter sp. AP23 TaxID=499656 RepID=UPI00076DD8D1|nr:zinc-binding dehydrogenase [Erythrobacter sp. AP23]KWV93975.1 zinc-binding dehydrogenase [Erythrobacter sp. AP23]